MWLRDALPHDLRDSDQPCARVMIYGYESGLWHSKSTQNLADVATAFREALLSLVSSAGPPKPIIFVAHSLGGLIVKEVSMYLSVDK